MPLVNDLHDALTTWSANLGWGSEALVRLLMAALLGVVIGYEREAHGHEAGLRTMLLVCLGSALAMVVSVSFARVDWPGLAAQISTSTPPTGQGQTSTSGPSPWIQIDPARVAYGVMGGIGFLGAGAIVHARGLVMGLTTAATIWCVAAIGLAAGFGLYLPAVATTLIVLTALYVLAGFEKAAFKVEEADIVLEGPCDMAQAVRFRKQLREAFASASRVDVHRHEDKIRLRAHVKHRGDVLEHAHAALDEHDTWRLVAVTRIEG